MNNGKYKAEQSTFWSEEHPVNHFQSRDLGKGSRTHAGTSCLPTLQSLNVSDLDGLSGKTSPVSCHLTEEKILVPSSERWGSWGMSGHTESWTLSGSEWPSDADVCSLSHILERGTLPQRFYLSPKACAGILRRAEKRGKELPPMLKQALGLVCQNEK